MTGKNIAPIGHQYLFRTPFGEDIWRDSPREFNGQRPRGSRPVYAEPPEASVVIRLLADKMMSDDTLRDRFDDAEHRLIANAIGKLGRTA